MDGHLSFLEQCFRGDDLPSEARASGAARAEAIRAHAGRSELHVAVVGEFSSGKSTLINALIRDPLLPADVLPGTTATAVVIRPGPKQFSARYLDGRVENVAAGPIFDARLQRLITEEETACSLAGISIDHPAPFLQQGILLVDLPGSNVENGRHSELAGKELKETCDTAIVVIPANIPVSESLTDFLNVHAAGILHRCIFVVSKIDLIQPGSRGQVLETIRRRLAAKLQISAPLVLAVSAEIFLGMPGASAAETQELQEQFLQGERRILETLREQRSLLLLERSAALLLDLFDQTGGGLKTSFERFLREQATLAGSAVSALRERIHEEKKKYIEAVEPRLEAAAGELAGRLAELKERTLGAAKAPLGAATSRSQLVQAATFGTDDLMAKARNELWAQLNESLAGIASAIRAEAAVFEGGLLSHYAAVGLSKIPIPAEPGGALVPGSWPDWKSPTFQIPSANTGCLVFYTGAGAIAGGFAGLALMFVLVAGSQGADGCLPGLAALGLGPIVGGILGNQQGEEIEPARVAYSQQVDSSIRDYFNQLESAVAKTLEKGYAAARAGAEVVGEEYSKKYEDVVAQSIAARQHEIAAIQHREKQIADGLLDLDRRRFTLRQVRGGLAKLTQI